MAFDKNYSNRKGFDTAFLSPSGADRRVFLPALSTELAKQAVPLLSSPTESVLHYHHYSVVMHKARRFAIYSAANVDFAGRFALARPKDVWRIDPRIPVEAQVGKAFYAKNQFDRGHLTRREDQEYGTVQADALAAATDTNHWTNCTPQHARFNEGKQLWQGIERHILEDAVDQNHFRAQVITGPVFDVADPTLEGFADTPYPVRYWKVVAAINASGKLFATAYILDQRETIAQFGLREAPEVPFTPYKTFQTTIAAIEKLTHLTFTGAGGESRISLAAFDPLTRQNDERRSSTRSLPEKARDEPIKPLTHLNQIVLDA